MSKFDKGPKGPVSKTEINEKDARLRVVQDTLITVNQKMFATLERESPALAEKFRSDFNEYIQTQIKMSAENANISLADVEEQIPNNLWIKVLRGQKSVEMSKEQMERASVEFKEGVNRKIKGTDIQ